MTSYCVNLFRPFRLDLSLQTFSDQGQKDRDGQNGAQANGALHALLGIKHFPSDDTILN